MKIVVFYNPEVFHPQYGYLDNLQACVGGEILRDEYYECSSVTCDVADKFIEDLRKDYPDAEIVTSWQ